MRTRGSREPSIIAVNQIVLFVFYASRRWEPLSGKWVWLLETRRSGRSNLLRWWAAWLGIIFRYFLGRLISLFLFHSSHVLSRTISLPSASKIGENKLRLFGRFWIAAGILNIARIFNQQTCNCFHLLFIFSERYPPTKETRIAVKKVPEWRTTHTRSFSSIDHYAHNKLFRLNNTGTVPPHDFSMEPDSPSRKFTSRLQNGPLDTRARSRRIKY